MALTIPELMHANLFDVFNQRDHTLRRAVIGRIYAEDIRWTEDDGVFVGHDELDAKAVQLQAALGDLQFVAAGPAHQTRGLGYLPFHLVKPGDDTPQVSGPTSEVGGHANREICGLTSVNAG